MLWSFPKCMQFCPVCVLGKDPRQKHIKYIIEFPPKAVEKLRQLGDVSAYAVLQKTGKYNMKKRQ